ncbi:MAG: DUF433 domain-containing protein [Planctomycetota bacterium]
MILIGRGVYSYSDAASLTQLKSARIREWFASRSEAKLGAIFQSDFTGQTEHPLISFLDLVDVFIAGQLRNSGMSLQTLRRIYRTLQQDYGVEHPFGRRELLTDGTKIFFAGLDSRGCKEVVDVLTKKKAFPTIILPFLKRLTFDPSSRLATKWQISKGVVVNPVICFGQPVLESKGIPTNIIARSSKANGGDLRTVADWYDMPVSQVKLALEFEARRAA